MGFFAKINRITLEKVRFELLYRFGAFISPEYKFTWYQLDWWKNSFFTNYLKKFNEHRGNNTHRRWLIYQFLRLIDQVPGDTAECGVYTGADSYLICHYNNNISKLKRTHFLFDSYEGLSKPQSNDGLYWQEGDLSASEQLVRHNLESFTNFETKKGWIPDRFSDVKNSTFAFVHVDVDLYQPTKDSIVFFYPRLNPGAVFICDDYGWETCPGSTQAIDEYLRDKPEKMIALPDGGGFFIKGISTSSY